MITPPELPSVATTRRTITYELDRFDLLANFMTIYFRSRIIQVLIFGALCSVSGLHRRYSTDDDLHGASSRERYHCDRDRSCRLDIRDPFRARGLSLSKIIQGES